MPNSSFLSSSTSSILSTLKSPVDNLTNRIKNISWPDVRLNNLSSPVTKFSLWATYIVFSSVIGKSAADSFFIFNQTDYQVDTPLAAFRDFDDIEKIILNGTCGVVNANITHRAIGYDDIKSWFSWSDDSDKYIDYASFWRGTGQYINKEFENCVITFINQAVAAYRKQMDQMNATANMGALLGMVVGFAVMGGGIAACYFLAKYLRTKDASSQLAVADDAASDPLINPTQCNTDYTNLQSKPVTGEQMVARLKQMLEKITIDDELKVFFDPSTQQLLTSPVLIVCDPSGASFDKEQIEKLIAENGEHPITGAAFTGEETTIPNANLLIALYKVVEKKYQGYLENLQQKQDSKQEEDKEAEYDASLNDSDDESPYLSPPFVLRK